MFCTVDLLRVFFKAVLTLHYVIVNYLPKIALLLTVGLTFVLHVFLYVFAVFYISVKTEQFKTSCKDDCGWITQLKQQISKRRY